jgi:hypothetical protein
MRYRCHTNHALDEFLEGLVNEGVDNVIRIGGQSKSVILARKNLRLQSQSQAKTMTEKSILRNAFSRSKEYEEMIACKIRLLRDVETLNGAVSGSICNVIIHMSITKYKIRPRKQYARRF